MLEMIMVSKLPSFEINVNFPSMFALVPLLECEKEMVAKESGSAVVKSFMTPSMTIFF